jgi:hypothetical protein
MGTRSRIGVMHGTVCKSVYCHWDGYLEHNGQILQKHYDSAKANHLVALGDMSSLGSKIGEQHAFSCHDLPADEVEAFKATTKDMCTFYGRDRGEKDTEFKVAHSFAEFLEQVDNCGGEYYYIMENGQWYCGSMYGEFEGRLVLLSEALESIKVAEES